MHFEQTFGTVLVIKLMCIKFVCPIRSLVYNYDLVVIA